MVLGMFGGGSDVADLIARRKYDKALEVIREQLKRGSADTRLRHQLTDVLILSGRGAEAVPVLMELADEYAGGHQAPKAIALLKKIERIQPGRSDVTGRLARLIKDKGKPRTRSSGYQPREGAAAEGYEPAGAVFSAEHFEASAAAVTEEQKNAASRAASWVPSTRQEQEEPAVPMIELPPEPEGSERSDEAFRGQILDVIQDVLHQPEPSMAEPEPAASEEVAESPLFSGFSHEELVAVIQGLRLLSFESGDILITEGDPGDSLFVISEGVVKAFVRAPDRPGQRLVRTMKEGDFFGEISILSGKPRTATVTAATRCELLELDRTTLDEILREHPRVQQVLEEFYIARASNEPAGG